jgi:hypothetical protein
VLPASLQHVEVKGVHYAQPLLALTQLKTLTITHGIAGLRYHNEPACAAADTNVLLAFNVKLTQVTSLTRIAIKGRRPTKGEMQQDGLQAAFDALPVDLSGLDPTATPLSCRSDCACFCKTQQIKWKQGWEACVGSEEHSTQLQCDSTAACTIHGSLYSATFGVCSAAARTMSSLGSLGGQGQRVCSMWAGVRVLVDVLMGHTKLGAVLL